MSGDTVVRIRDSEVDRLLRDPEIADLLMNSSLPIVARARLGAPKRTGRGAASIHAESVLDGPEITVHVSWSRDAFYMYFQDQGTSRLPALHFLEDALEGAV